MKLGTLDGLNREDHNQNDQDKRMKGALFPW